VDSNAPGDQPSGAQLELVVVDPVGGLGNSLFSVSAGFALARRHGCRFAIRQLDFVPGHCSEISPHYPHGWPVYWDTVFRKFRVEPFENGSLEDVEFWDPQGFVELDSLVPDGAKRIRVSGYFQNARFFDSYKDEIASLTREPPPDIADYIDQKYEIAPSTKVLIIGVRQSADYAENDWLLPVNYYLNAHRFFREATDGEDYRVIAVADENDWVRANLKPKIGDLVLADERDNPLGHHMSVIQFYLMMRGTAFILSNSTFHWWGAYLADTRLILSPKHHHNPYRVTMPGRASYHEIGEEPRDGPRWTSPAIRVVGDD
jgi:hypothetical protein